MIMPAQAKGFSLSELLIAMFLSSLLMTAMGKAYLSVKSQYRWFTQRLEEMHDNYLLTDWLREQFKLSQFGGCRLSERTKNVLGSKMLSANDVALPSVIVRKAKKNSTVIQLNTLSPWTFVKKVWPLSERILLAPPSSRLKKGDVVLLSDCLHQISGNISKAINNGQTIILNKPLPKDIQPQAVIGKLQQRYLYIRAVREQYSLYIFENGRSEELMDDIEALLVTALAKRADAMLYRLQLSRKFHADLSLKFISHG